jgi:hypothetical protein
VDDWELSGDGSGDARELQLEPMHELVRIYDAHGIHGSFNAEIMQQLTFRHFEKQHAELKTLADEWDSIVWSFWPRRIGDQPLRPQISGPAD